MSATSTTNVRCWRCRQCATGTPQTHVRTGIATRRDYAHACRYELAGKEETYKQKKCKALWDFFFLLHHFLSVNRSALTLNSRYNLRPAFETQRQQPHSDQMLFDWWINVVVGFSGLTFARDVGFCTRRRMYRLWLCMYRWYVHDGMCMTLCISALLHVLTQSCIRVSCPWHQQIVRTTKAR